MSERFLVFQETPKYLYCLTFLRNLQLIHASIFFRVVLNEMSQIIFPGRPMSTNTFSKLQIIVLTNLFENFPVLMVAIVKLKTLTALLKLAGLSQASDVSSEKTVFDVLKMTKIFFSNK